MFTVIEAFATITSNMARAEGVPPSTPNPRLVAWNRTASLWLDVVSDH